MFGALKRFIPVAGASGWWGAAGNRAIDTGRKVGGESPQAPKGFRRLRGDALPDAVRSRVDDALATVVMGAHYLPRSANDDGPRVAVISAALGGGFIFDREEAARRIRLNFPVDEKQLRRAVALMQSRVRLAMAPQDKPRRGGWVHGWREDPERMA